MSYLAYKQEFVDFLATYKTGVTDAATVGEVIMHMVQYFSEANLRHAELDSIRARKARDFEKETDPTTGKSLSSARAKILSDASDEAAAEREAAAHLENISAIINGCKSMQKGLLNEFSYNSAT